MDLAVAMPKDDADGDGYVKGVLCSVLRDFQGEVRVVYNFLLYSCDFIAKDEGIFCLRISFELVEFD
jgi:hypothetical protein